MKKCFFILLIVTIAGFSFIGMVIFKGKTGVSAQPSKKFYLNTQNMVEAGVELDSNRDLVVIKQFLYGKHFDLNSTIPGADVFVCKILKSDLSRADTVLILDTALRKSSSIVDFTIFWARVDTINTLKACQVYLPKDEITKLKKYKFKYGKVLLITDD